MFNSLPVGIGQVHFFNELFKADPRLAFIVLLLIILLAMYLNRR